MRSKCFGKADSTNSKPKLPKMGNTLISGPAGAGKSNLARDLLSQVQGQGAIIDFQALYSAALLLRRRDDGRYPERDPADAHLLALAEYTRKAMITAALLMDIEIIATNSSGSPQRREYLLGLLGPGAFEVVLDPGRAIVEERLSINGVLSQQCRDGINRWFGALPNG